MTSEYNPFVDSDNRSSRTLHESKLYLGLVITAPARSRPEDKFAVEVKTRRYPTGTLAQLQPTSHGDLYIPPEGSFVLLRKSIEEDLIVIKSFYHDQSWIPDIKTGERLLGHPLTDAKLHFKQDGEVVLHSPKRTLDTKISNPGDVNRQSQLHFSKNPHKASLVSETVDADGVQPSFSRVDLEPGGTVTIENDSGSSIVLQPNGDVVINEGNTRPITDITFGTDNDGHYTSHTIERANDVYVPY